MNRAIKCVPAVVATGGGIFLNPNPGVANGAVLAANASDGGLDCRRHNSNNRLDTRAIQKWIDDAIQAYGAK